MVFFSLALLSSCVRHDDNLLVRMEEIKELGNHNPQLAMQKLDSELSVFDDKTQKPSLPSRTMTG